MTTLSPPQIAAAARAGGFSGSQVPIMTAIAMAESSGRTDVTHHNSDGSTDYGVWQINSVHSDILALGNWADPAVNARMAFAVYKKQGYSAWSVFKSNSYLTHLATAQTAAGQSASLPTTTIPSADTSGSATGVNLLTSPHTWLRVAMILAGWMLIVVSLAIMGWSNAPEPAKKIAKAVILKKVV